jgi:phytoene desaturase
MKRVVIIGGGIAGLTAGIFARRNGFSSIILEKHHTLGGECTGWDRYGYHIDGCIHWLVGTKEGTPIRRLWEEVGALEGVDIYHPESFLAHEHKGTVVHFYRDLERLKSSWLEISPEDKGPIEQLCRDIKTLQSFTLPVGKPMDMMNIREKLRYLISMKDIGPVVQKYSKTSIQDFANSFSHPSLREALSSFMPADGYSALTIVFPLGTFTGDQSSIPYGGSKALARRMVDQYISLGGRVEASCEVSALEIDKKSVKRVICNNGEVFEADYFIAACDAHLLYEHLLNGQYNDPKFKKRYNNPKDYPLASNIYIGVGYEGTMDDVPRTIRFPVEAVDIKQNGKLIEHLQMTHYGYEKDFAPVGHTVITFAINQFQPELDCWDVLDKDKEAYKVEKSRIGAAVIKATETRFPHMKGKLKLLDVASPKTYEHYCNAYRGAFMGFWPTLRGKTLSHTGRIRGLKNIFLSGQWLQPPGGLPVALITGKDTIMRLCRREGIDFS